MIILIKGEIIFSETGILLLELAKELQDWINNSFSYFNYESMDYEDSPILFFKEQDLNSWQIGSVWMDEIYTDFKLSELIDGCENFIDKLTHDLSLNQINIKQFL